MRKAIRHLEKADPVLGAVIRKVGAYTIEYSAAEFSTIARCITYQQLSGKAALRVYLRLEKAAGNGAALTPEGALSLSPDEMRAIGLSRRKVEYIQGFARACEDGEIRLDDFESMSDEEVMRLLTSYRGIGPWTVHMYLIFALRRLDVLPTGDLGVRLAMQRVYGLDKLPGAAEMQRIAAPWRPYATVGTWYMWRSLGDGAGLDPVID
jgi:DNA-3-methyladenine glycosylase II